MMGEESYRENLLTLIEMFEYEHCFECGQGLELHNFGPDPLGNPHAYCLTGDSDRPTGLLGQTLGDILSG